MIRRILLIILCLFGTVYANQLPYFADVNGTKKFLISPTQEEPEPPVVNPPDALYIGIPAPFGMGGGDANAIDITYRIYDDSAKRTASGLPYQESAGGGYFTHYVDNNDPASTDSSNTYGSIAKPRKSLPNSMPAGSIVEVHSTKEVQFYRFQLLGTEDLPVFVRGVGNPVMTNGFNIANGQYGIVEGILFDDVGVIIRGFTDTPSTRIHHIAIRDNEMRGSGTLYVNNARVTVGSTASPFPNVDNIVVYDNYIHDAGDSSSSSPESGNDAGGVHVGSYVNYLWILGNHIHDCGGDSILLCHGANFTSGHIYIGGNVLHDDRENAIDIKQCNDVIVSQNEMYGYEPTSSSAGEAVVIHYEPNNIWFLFNKIHDATQGIVSTGCYNQYVIGNVIYNIEGSVNPSTPYSPHRHGIGIRWYATNTPYVVGNTLYNCVTGIGADILTSTPIIANNIISQRNPSYDGYLIALMGTGLSGSVMENNLLYQTGESARIYWGGTYNGVANFQASTGKGSGCVESDPLFQDPANGDFTIDAKSPILTMALSSEIDTVSDTFYSLYEIRIADYVKHLFTDRIIYAPNAE